ncbi:hypothetical protein [Paracraurococcus ruber]|uniref:Uncharacterized protein n=1 Tax=Paracraurococcus ruber TaxID=77675 RepID=A0ABS1D1P9_9PROT|nr:hypothetical protein [Paracraurococcus ruber]MBK1660746.1 hypothetical protein [Paracraurococcus ruber]TDG27153.1 hypothetical protein E2C05_23930 [Paracraurococcus ruber]
MKMRPHFLTRYSLRLFCLPELPVYEIMLYFANDSDLREGGFQRVRAGPGGGYPATPFTVAFLMLATAWQGLTKGKTTQAGWLLYRLPGECPITGQSLFGHALRRVLSDPAIAETVASVEVSTFYEDARILWKDGMMSRFVRDPIRAQLAVDGAQHIVVWPGKLLHEVACDISTQDQSSAPPAAAQPTTAAVH